MSESIPKLRRTINELQARIRELEVRPAETVERVVYRDRIVPTYRDVPVDNPEHIEMIKRLQAKCQSISQ